MEDGYREKQKTWAMEVEKEGMGEQGLKQSSKQEDALGGKVNQNSMSRIPLGNLKLAS